MGRRKWTEEELQKHLNRLSGNPIRQEPKRNRYGMTKSNKEERTYDGIVFDSKSEMSFYKELQRFNIPFKTQAEFILVPGFRYRPGDRKQSAMKCKIDFHFDQFPIPLYVDIKGVVTEPFSYRVRLLKAKFASEISDPEKRPVIMVVKPKKIMTFISVLLKAEFNIDNYNEFIY